MTGYLVRRLAFAMFLVLAVSSLSLVLTRLAPGDYAIDAFGVRSFDSLEQARERLGLKQPIGGQYLDWMANAVRLDFGRSLVYDRPVSELVPERAVNTALLAVTALTLATLIGLPLGILSGTRSRGLLPGLIRAGSLTLLSMPPILTSLFLVYLAARTGWFPISGMRSANEATSDVMDLARHMVVPALSLALPIAAMFERLQADAISDAMKQPFVLAALARGVPRRRLVWRGALKTALGPVVSVYGLLAGSLLSGSFVVEMITAWPGLGRLMLDALRARDVYLVAGCAAAGSLFLAIGTLLSDVALAAIDPRTGR